MKKFLSAKWHDLIMANYAVEPSLLAKLVPAGTSLDLHEGKCFISLVGFMFLETRVLGFLVPFHVNFEEVNLRFYVRRETGTEIRRGVVFIKEIVPRFAIAAVARMLYGEPYEAWRMDHIRNESRVAYAWSKAGCSNNLQVNFGESLGVPPDRSEGRFFIEHYWGYTRRSEKRTDEYKVDHVKWEIFSVSDPVVDVDFGKTYGREFAFLSDVEPYSVLLAKGSQISVYKGEKIS